MNRFAKFAWGVLLYNIAVVVWGAYVRASKSGAGCGEHWPDCNGQIIPQAPTVKTIIEFTHRTTSGLAGILVIVLLIWALRTYAKGHVVRITAWLSFGFIVIEGLIGALLVKKGLVAENDSVARAIYIAVHLTNTLILLAVLALTAWWATTKTEAGAPLQFRGNAKPALILGACLFGIILLSVTGAITALGATLFPVTSIAEGIARDLSPRHFLESLIWIHPVAAVFLGLILTFCVVFIGSLRKGAAITTMMKTQIGLVVTQLILGGVNLLLHAPVWLQLVHLLMADLVWVNLVLFTAAVLAVEKAPAPVQEAEQPELAAAIR
ncbi:MAG TPA: COX15/CtaA family protein [Blastocatellia bacterium]|nr:COX15/CtaA family protein [Blastocatellia bacterium]